VEKPLKFEVEIYQPKEESDYSTYYSYTDKTK